MNGLVPLFCLALLPAGPGDGSIMERVSISELRAAVNGRTTGFASGDVEFSNVSLDSRTLAGNDLFWAVRGERVDGHAYVADAVLSGAVAVVAEPGKADNVIGPIVRVRPGTSSRRSPVSAKAT